MSEEQLKPHSDSSESENSDLVEIKLLVPEKTARAWQRCTWLIACETGKKRTEVMSEMIHDFLFKNGC